MTKTGCQWRMLPKDFPPKSTVFVYFQQWRTDKTIDRVHRKLRKICRVIADKQPDETVGIIDSQSVKTSEEAESRGYDAGKKIKGRKRHLIVDTLGLIIEAMVHTAGIQDRVGGKYLVNKAKTNGATFTKGFADGGYLGKFIDHTKQTWGVDFEVVKRNELHKFVVLPKRWIVERTNSWLLRSRRLAKDYERHAETARQWILLAMIRIMMRRIQKEYVYVR